MLTYPPSPPPSNPQGMPMGIGSHLPPPPPGPPMSMPHSMHRRHHHFQPDDSRKPVQRHYIDPSNCFLLSEPSDFPDNRFCPPHPAFTRTHVLLPSILPSAGSVATRYARVSINKVRCPIHSLIWTPGGRRLITGARTGEFTLWNGTSFNFVTIQQAHDCPIRDMVGSHNGEYMLSCDKKGTIKYWKANLNNLSAFLGHPECIRDLAFSPSDSKFLSASDDCFIKIWDFALRRPEQLLKGHGNDVRSADWHPFSSLIASGGKDYTTKLWDARTHAHVTDLVGHTNTIVKVRWNMNGNWLLTGSRDRNLRIYDIRTMRDFQTFKGHPREITTLDWHPIQERLFASGGYDGALLYWEVGQEQPLGKVLHAHDSAIWCMQWHPVGNVLATGSNDHTTKFWIRNRPGDTLCDYYNVDQMPEGTEDDGSIKKPTLRRSRRQGGGGMGMGMSMGMGMGSGMGMGMGGPGGMTGNYSRPPGGYGVPNDRQGGGGRERGGDRDRDRGFGMQSVGYLVPSSHPRVQQDMMEMGGGFDDLAPPPPPPPPPMARQQFHSQHQGSPPPPPALLASQGMGRSGGGGGGRRLPQFQY